MGSKPLGDFAHRLNMLSATNLAAALRRKLLIATFFDIMIERHTRCCTKRDKQRLYLTDHPKTAVVSGYQISARGEHELAFEEGPAAQTQTHCNSNHWYDCTSPLHCAAKA